MEPRRRIFMTSILALAAALVVSVIVIGGQRSSGRAALTQRATEFVRLLKGPDDGRGRRFDFLRPEDRQNPKLLVGLRRLEAALSTLDADVGITEVEMLPGGHGRTFIPGAEEPSPGRGPLRVSLRQIDWIRGGDGLWYVDPMGL